MRILILYGIMLHVFFSCKAQEKATLHYIGHRYTETKNKNFINDELIFVKKEDTLIMNIKLPFDRKNKQIINRGIFYNCYLKENNVYTITLKKICINDIPEVHNSYYKSNTVPDKKDCSKFIDVERDTEYNYKGNYGKFVDINGVLFEVIGISPSDNCFFLH